MAVIIPYGDAQAHGSIANSVTFRRFRGRVVFQKKPHARVPGTPAQIVQRQKFKDAWKAFHALDYWALEYCKYKAIERQTTAALFFISQYLKDEIPSTTPHSGIKDITDLDIPEPFCTEDLGIQFSFLARTDPDVDVELAHIWDKQNQFADGVVADPYDRIVLYMHRTITDPIQLPFNYPLLVWWNNFSDEPKHNLIRLPHLTFAPNPSTTPWDQLTRIIEIQLYTPGLPGASQVHFKVIAECQDPLVELLYFLDIFNMSPGIKWVGMPVIIWPVTYIKIRFESSFVGTFTVPDNWVMTIRGHEKDQPSGEWNIIFPSFSLENTESIEFWIANDLSLWYDRAMTNLAKWSGTLDKYLYLAQDFSLYYDKEMIQLANAPYF